MTHDFVSKGPDVLDDMHTMLAQQLQVRGDLAPDAAVAVAEEITSFMAMHWGGMHVYFPKGYYRRVSETHRDIYTRFTGNNIAELARETGMTERHIQRIVKYVREQDRAARQQGLFD